MHATPAEDQWVTFPEFVRFDSGPDDSKGTPSSQPAAGGFLAKKGAQHAASDRDGEASKPGAVPAMMPRDGGPQYKHQVQSVAPPDQGSAREDNRKGGARAKDGGPDYKDQAREVTPPSPPGARRPAPARDPGAEPQVEPGAAEAVQDQDTPPLSSESVSQQEDRAPTDTAIIPSAVLVCDSSVYEAHPMTNRRPRTLVWAVAALAALAAVGVTAFLLGARSASSPDYDYSRPDNDDGEDYSSQRGPCPALNTLANHGYINRDGRNINVRDMADAIELVFGADAGDMLDIINNSTYLGGLKTVGVAEDGNTSLINLFDLHVLDHDASLVREDPGFYKPYPGFNESLFERLTAHAVDGVLTGMQGEAHQRERIKESRRDNPDANFTETIGHVMALQGCLLQFFGAGPVKETVRVDELESFLKEEKIPESFVLRGENGLPPILRNDYASQESRWSASVMEALAAPVD